MNEPREFFPSDADLDTSSGSDAEPAWASMSPLPVEAVSEPNDSLSGDALGLAAERVRFSVPVAVQVSGTDKPSDGVIVNICENGLACVLPMALHDHEQVQCHFRPALGEQHLTLGAEVIWQRHAGEQDSLYGLHFTDLSADDRERIAGLVKERSEGRAAEWTLPVVPMMPSARPPRVSPYMSAALGLAAGVTLSLLLSFVPSLVFGGDASADWPPIASSPSVASTVPAEAKGLSPAALPVAEPASVEAQMPLLAIPDVPKAAAPLTPAVAPVLDAKPVVAKTEPSVAPASKEPASVPSKASAAAPVATSGLHASAPVAKAVAKPAAPAPVVAARPASAKLTKPFEIELSVDRAVTTYNTFWLDSPRRLVVDIPGVRRAANAKDLDLISPLASKVRVGTHGDRVRFVVDVSERAASTVPVRVQGSSLILALSPR